MSRHPRWLLDAEALLRAWRNDGPARELLVASVHDFSLCTSTAILDAVDEVLARLSFNAPADERLLFRRTILVGADAIALVDESSVPRRSPDPGDDHVIEAALRTGADVVVSQHATDLAHEGYDVLPAALAGERLRATEPFGTTVRLAGEERAAGARDLATVGGPPKPRRGGDVRFRAATDALAHVEDEPGWRFATVGPQRAAELAIDLIAVAGQRLRLHSPDRHSFAPLCGTWLDGPGRGVPFSSMSWASQRRRPPSPRSPATTVGSTSIATGPCSRAGSSSSSTHPAPPANETSASWRSSGSRSARYHKSTTSTAT